MTQLVELRPYQAKAEQEILDALSIYDRVLFVLPTGGGKTFTFSHFTKKLSEKRISILVHRQELMDQISESLSRINVAHGFYADKSQERVLIGTVQAVARNVSKLESPDYIIFDEAHHAVAGQWAKIVDAWKCKVLGVTATPCRADGVGLGNIFEHMVKGPTMQELIDMGNLVPSEVYTFNSVNTEGMGKRMGDYKSDDIDKAITAKVHGDAIGTYKELSIGKKAVVFTHNVQGAKDICIAFGEHGYKFEPLYGDMPKEKRKTVVEQLRDGLLDGIASCDIVSEGFDCPALETAILLRPTMSTGLYLQQVGRVLRPAKDKAFGLILDHVGNVRKHGLPEDERDISLEGEGLTSKKNDVLIKRCEACLYTYRYKSGPCPKCGHVKEIKQETVVVECELSKYDKNQVEIDKASYYKVMTMARKVGVEPKKLSDFQRANFKLQYARGWAYFAYSLYKRFKHIEVKQMAEKIYIGQGKQSKFGVKCSLCLDDIPQNAQPVAKNGKRYVNFEIKAKKEADQYGKTHYLELDTWQPPATKSEDLPF